DLDVQINDIQGIGNQVWLATVHGAYRIEGERVSQITISVDSDSRIGKIIHLDPDDVVEVRSIKGVSGQVWLETPQGAYRVQGDKVRRIPDDDLLIHDIREIDGSTWLIASEGAYRVDGDIARPVTNLGVHQIEKIEGNVWIATSQGAYVVEGEVLKRIPDK